MNLRKRVVLLLSVCLLLVATFAPVTVVAQDGSQDTAHRFYGVVTDVHGVPIHGAKVMTIALFRTAPLVTYTTTNADGAYATPELASGAWYNPTHRYRVFIGCPIIWCYNYPHCYDSYWHWESVGKKRMGSDGVRIDFQFPALPPYEYPAY